MDFLTEKKDAISELVCRDFPCVNVIQINDDDIIHKIATSERLYVDSRLNLDNYPDIYDILLVVGYYDIKAIAKGYHVTRNP